MVVPVLVALGSFTPWSARYEFLYRCLAMFSIPFKDTAPRDIGEVKAALGLDGGHGR